MASRYNRLGTTIIRTSFRTRPGMILQQPVLSRRYLHASSFLRDDEQKKPPRARPAMVGQERYDQLSNASAANSGLAESPLTSDHPPEPASSPVIPPSQAQTAPDMPADVEFQDENEGRASESHWPNTPAERAEQAAAEKEFYDLLDNPPAEARGQAQALRRSLQQAEDQIVREWESTPDPMDDGWEPRVKFGLMAQGEDNPLEEGEDDLYKGDDMTSLAHGDLEQHREIRHYARIAAWEMPLLTKHSTPYELPTKAPLRFRHTNYMGESHPADKKIVLEFCTADLPLTPAQRLKLVKLVGVRYDPQKDIVKMSCEMFESPAQNKRYLGDLVDTLMLEARSATDAEGGRDAFEDVPVDFRHVKWKKRYAFPEEWKLTEGRRTELGAVRSGRAREEAKRVEDGRMVNGRKLIEQSLTRQPALERAAFEQSRIKAAPYRA